MIASIARLEHGASPCDIQCATAAMRASGWRMAQVVPPIVLCFTALGLILPVEPLLHTMSGGGAPSHASIASSELRMLVCPLSVDQQHRSPTYHSVHSTVAAARDAVRVLRGDAAWQVCCYLPRLVMKVRFGPAPRPRDHMCMAGSYLHC
jgi:hypothetical protein